MHYDWWAQVVKACASGQLQVIEDARRVAGEEEKSDYVPTDASEFCGRLLHTCYMGMEQNSSAETRARAKLLAAQLGAFHKVQKTPSLSFLSLYLFSCSFFLFGFVFHSLII